VDNGFSDESDEDNNGHLVISFPYFEAPEERRAKQYFLVAANISKKAKIREPASLLSSTDTVLHRQF
jgi:hypothetical protein